MKKLTFFVVVFMLSTNSYGDPLDPMGGGLLDDPSLTESVDSGLNDPLINGGINDTMVHRNPYFNNEYYGGYDRRRDIGTTNPYGRREIEIRERFNYDPTEIYRGEVDRNGDFSARDLNFNRLRGEIDNQGDGWIEDDNGNRRRIIDGKIRDW
ncbi:MAG: hypothetical protein D6732_19645 [Methanobacteriota archaeon]|nr:MAG: hypothetical protein D6732_19645 [Euryarchaeota archaeon]